MEARCLAVLILAQNGRESAQVQGRNQSDHLLGILWQRDTLGSLSTSPKIHCLEYMIFKQLSVWSGFIHCVDAKQECSEVTSFV